MHYYTLGTASRSISNSTVKDMKCAMNIIFKTLPNIFDDLKDIDSIVLGPMLQFKHKPTGFICRMTFRSGVPVATCDLLTHLFAKHPDCKF